MKHYFQFSSRLKIPANGFGLGEGALCCACGRVMALARC